MAVLPFNPIGAVPRDAEILHGDFEAGLVKTEAFFVIPQEEMNASLAEEGYGLFECTDERCAYDLGIQLHAGQVTLGELGYDRAMYTLNLRVVDVPTDGIVYVDRISRPSLQEMREAMELSAFRLAGLVVDRSGKPQIASEFTQVLVETVPPRAKVYINGVWKGSSPALFSRVPLGRITISASLDELYGEKVVETTKGVLQARLELVEASGGLRIASPEDLDVYLDGQQLGKVQSGPFRNLAAGIRVLELKGRDLYWREHVQIPGNRLAVVEARPRAYGTIEYSIPDGAVARIEGPMFRQVVRGYGVMPAPAGKYLVAVAGIRYETREAIQLSVPQGATVAFAPELDYAEDYEYARFQEEIQEAERSLAFGYRLSSSDLERFRKLKQAVESSKHDFPDLVHRAESLIEKAGGAATLMPSAVKPEPEIEPQTRAQLVSKRNGLLARQQELGLQLEAKKLTRKRRSGWGWATFGLGVASGGLAGLAYYLGNQVYDEYQAATILTPFEELLRLENAVKLWDATTIAAIGVSGACAIASSILLLSGPSTRSLEQDLQSLRQELQDLEKQLR